MQLSVPEQLMILIIQITARGVLGNQSSHGDIGNSATMIAIIARNKTRQVILLACGSSDITGCGEMIKLT